MKRLVRRFNRDEKASIAHALMHLETNKIADDDYPGHSGWYCGNREQFVERHKKAVASCAQRTLERRYSVRSK